VRKKKQIDIGQSMAELEEDILYDADDGRPVAVTLCKWVEIITTSVDGDWTFMCQMMNIFATRFSCGSELEVLEYFDKR